MSNQSIENISETAESAQLILQNVTILSELTYQLKKETKNGENYINSLSTLLCQAEKDVSTLNQSVASLITVAKQLVFLSLQIIPKQDPNFKTLQHEAEKLLNILDEIKVHDDLDEKWKPLVQKNIGAKCVNIDEKYPEHCSKESLLDMNNIVSLQTVPEDIFTDFHHKPNRTVSSSSLKNLRKVKLCLQKVCALDDAETMTEEGSKPPCNFKEYNGVSIFYKPIILFD